MVGLLMVARVAHSSPQASRDQQYSASLVLSCPGQNPLTPHSGKPTHFQHYGVHPLYHNAHAPPMPLPSAADRRSFDVCLPAISTPPILFRQQPTHIQVNKCSLSFLLNDDPNSAVPFKSDLPHPGHSPANKTFQGLPMPPDMARRRSTYSDISLNPTLCMMPVHIVSSNYPPGVDCSSVHTSVMSDQMFSPPPFWSYVPASIPVQVDQGYLGFPKDDPQLQGIFGSSATYSNMNGMPTPPVYQPQKAQKVGDQGYDPHARDARKTTTQNGASKWQCSQCQTTFGRPYDLKRHLLSVHKKERKYPCSLCSWNFLRKVCLFFDQLEL